MFCFRFPHSRFSRASPKIPLVVFWSPAQTSTQCKGRFLNLTRHHVTKPIDETDLVSWTRTVAFLLACALLVPPPAPFSFLLHDLRRRSRPSPAPARRPRPRASTRGEADDSVWWRPCCSASRSRSIMETRIHDETTHDSSCAPRCHPPAIAP